MNAAKKLVTFVKKETVLCIAGLLAVVSMFIIHPSADYLVISITACLRCCFVLWQ